jgi:hypothetical protein
MFSSQSAIIHVGCTVASRCQPHGAEGIHVLYHTEKIDWLQRQAIKRAASLASPFDSPEALLTANTDMDTT